ncbi:MAG: ABC transporter substrate-binding protein, partial [Burkholderiales bacterium]
MQSRRTFLASAVVALATAITLGSAPTSAQNQKVIKVGTLKLIHGITPYFYEKFTPAGYKV